MNKKWKKVSIEYYLDGLLCYTLDNKYYRLQDQLEKERALALARKGKFDKADIVTVKAGDRGFAFTREEVFLDS